MKSDNINVLIIGGLGFIGWNLTKYLLSAGRFNINILDKKPVWFNDYEFDNLCAKCETATQSLSFTECDIDRFYIEDGMDIKKPDVIFHFGEYSRVEKSLESQADLLEVIESNFVGTGNVFLKYIRDMKDTLFFYAGSSTRFSFPGACYQSPYAFTKFVNSQLTKHLYKWYGLKTGVMYFYNVFGEGEQYNSMGTVVGKFKKNYLANERINVYGGQQTRRFTYIGDVIRNITNLMIYALENGLKGEEFHMVSPSVPETSINKLAHLFYDDSMINFLPMKGGCRMASIDNRLVKQVRCYGEYNMSVDNYIKIFKDKISRNVLPDMEKKKFRKGEHRKV